MLIDIIPQKEVDSFLAKVKAEMAATHIFSESTIQRTRLLVIHPNNWELSLLVPYKECPKSGIVRKAIEKLLFGVCGVDRMCCDYFGKQKSQEAYEWYFRYPYTPEDICERIEAEIEAELGNEIGVGLPTPKGFKSKTDTVFMTLKDEYFKEIEAGRKTTEYRNLNQYYCDKLFSPGVKKKYIKFNRGYESGKENQMVFEIKDILLVSNKLGEIPARNKNGKLITSYEELPAKFTPTMYGILLGKRVG